MLAVSIVLWHVQEKCHIYLDIRSIFDRNAVLKGHLAILTQAPIFSYTSFFVIFLMHLLYLNSGVNLQPRSTYAKINNMANVD